MHQGRSSVDLDLDVLGQTSLYRLICTAETTSGRRQLQRWLSEPAAIEEIDLRQKAVREVAPLLTWRQELQQACGRLGRQQSAVDRLLSWSEQPQRTCPRSAIRFAQGSALLSFLLIVLTVAQIGPPSWVFGMLLLVVGVHLALTVLWSGAIHEFLSGVSPTAAGLGADSLSAPLRRLSSADVESDRMTQLQSSANQACAALSRLERLLFLANLRRNPGTTLMVYLPLQLLFQWDVLILQLLEAWQRRDGRLMRTWFDALGQAEALASLASLSFDHPDWCFPNVDANADRMGAVELGHPLLPNSQRVSNDVTVGPSGSVLLLTGSNMSGKSTLLRAIGVNVMLAQSGAPCCATALRLPPLVVATSMRVSDSLAAGESLFMAEVLRLKEILDRGRELEETSQRTMLYLFDEILHGTNSAERRIAVLRVLGHLLRTNAVGAVSTHDLELARAPELDDACELVHLREAIDEGPDGPQMSFDYRLRPGCAPTTNALRLVAMLGLDEQ